MPEGLLQAAAVVVPAHNEAAGISDCLRAVAAASLPVARAGVPVEVVVVADSCTDATADIARAAGVHVLEVQAGSVGAARATGCAQALRVLDGLLRQSSWLAMTDADSIVPRDWLSAQVRIAAAGYQAAAGLVCLDGTSPTHVAQRWDAAYEVSRASSWLHDRVHGANLGVRADAYRRVGGFDAVSAHEDVRLVRRLQATGCPVAWPDRPVVTTSARMCGRAAAGLAADLRRLA